MATLELGNQLTLKNLPDYGFFFFLKLHVQNYKKYVIFDINLIKYYVFK